MRTNTIAQLRCFGAFISERGARLVHNEPPHQERVPARSSAKLSARRELKSAWNYRDESMQSDTNPRKDRTTHLELHQIERAAETRIDLRYDDQRFGSFALDGERDRARRS